MSEHQQRLLAANKSLLLQLDVARRQQALAIEFARSLTDPEQFGHAVTQEVRVVAARLIEKFTENHID